jgi:predicted RNase H-like HicB family nuclease
MSKYAIVYERAGDGTWSAMIPDLPGVWSIGSTIPKARANVLDCAEGWLELQAEQGAMLPDRVHKVEEVSITLPRSLVARRASRSLKPKKRTRSR